MDGNKDLLRLILFNSIYHPLDSSLDNGIFYYAIWEREKTAAPFFLMSFQPVNHEWINLFLLSTPIHSKIFKAIFKRVQSCVDDNKCQFFILLFDPLQLLF